MLASYSFCREKGEKTAMRYLVDSNEMKQADKNTIEHYGIASEVLMERAALKVVEAIGTEPKGMRVLVVCGTGNNGGDGLAVARMLHLQGIQVVCLYPGNEQNATKENQRQLRTARAYHVPIRHVLSQEPYDVVIDALFGVGLSREIRDGYEELILALNERKARKIAIDIPSGISADDGSVYGCAFRADETITFGFEKLGHTLYPGAEYTGRLTVCEMGIDEESFLGDMPKRVCMEQKDLQLIPQRKAYSHKGTYGKVLLIAGKRNMAGACIFAAQAAYQAGCGLVKILTPEANRTIIQQAVPQAVLETYQEAECKSQSRMEEKLRELSDWADVIAIGPGMGYEKNQQWILKTVLQIAKKRIILDADAIRILTDHMEWFQKTEAECVVTPHVLEMARMVQRPVEEIQAHLLKTAEQFAATYQVCCILKDARSVIASSQQTAINQTGNHGMAVGGSGDVLTGILAGFLAQGMEIHTGACMAAYVHGSAADLIREEVGTYSMQPQDLLRGIQKVLKLRDR